MPFFTRVTKQFCGAEPHQGKVLRRVTNTVRRDAKRDRSVTELASVVSRTVTTFTVESLILYSHSCITYTMTNIISFP